MEKPQLGKRGLYSAIGGDSDQKALQMAMLWVLNYADGTHSLLDIADKADTAFRHIAQIAHVLEQHALLEEAK